MGMKPQLQTSLKQQLKVTPHLQQAIEMLQLSSQELEKEIEKSLENNPLLEITEESPSANEQTPETDTSEASSSTQPGEALEAAPQQSSPEDTREYYNTSDAPKTRSYENDGSTQELSDLSANTLQEHLLWQMRLTSFSDKDRLIAIAIIDAISDSGYLTCSLEDILTTMGEDSLTELDEIEAVLERIHQFDPIGVGSRNLQEYLLIQLHALPAETEGRDTATTIIKDHIDLLAKHGNKQLKQLMGLKSNELVIAIDLIQSLNPRLSYNVPESKPDYVIPDVIVLKQQGKWIIELNASATPRIQINPDYESLTKGMKKDSDSEQLKEQLQNAKWLLRSLATRNETLLKVASCIMEKQQDFLEQGDLAMKPLILQDIASLTDLHESTVSRITTHKYIQTPRGVYELKYFFSSALKTERGNECSSTAIRAMIKKFIGTEDKTKPFSDDKLAKMLEDQGIHIARRTIAKYRESMGIRPSSERRR